MISQQDGKFLLKIARKAIANYLKNRTVIDAPNNLSPIFRKKMGVFVTIHKKGDLRGCIGYPEPMKPLINAVIDSAISASVGDPRFPPMQLDELVHVDLELSVLTPPQKIVVENPTEYLEKIKVGTDGLIIEKGHNKGLLLPQVPLEWNWDVEEFLVNTCLKAGLQPDCWYDKDVEVYKFQAQIFQESVD
ncbi:MAG: TIGR00296 family protein [Methanobacteriaceae archaeon]|nr:TIGR00296 family protein [Methanobacteriaceae archaeon]